MIIKENSSASNFEVIAEGLYPAVCVTVAGIGIQETPWGNREKVILTFELPTCRREWEKDGEKHEGAAHLSNTYTASLAQNAKLRAVLESWRGRPFTADELGGFDLSDILGASCSVLIKHNTAKDGRVFANVVDILKSKDKVKAEADLVDYDPMNHSSESFAQLPDWIATKVTHATDADAIDVGAPPKRVVEELEADEIPF